MVNRYLRNLVVWAIILAVVVYFFLPLYRSKTPREEISYSQFLNYAQADRIADVTIGDDTVTGKLRDGQPFRTFVPPNDTSYLSLLQSKGVTIKVEPKSRNALWPNLLSTMLPFFLLIGLWLLMLRQAQSGSNQAMSFGKSRARLHTENRPKVTFDDVAGVDEAKEELQEVIEFLKHPKKFQALGAKIPRGVLLVGPPGSGKTLLAKAVAGEAGVPFFSISGSEFVEMFVGVGASRVRDLFEQAKKSAPCLVFIDEIDAVGRQRGAGLGGGHDEREQTLNQLLVEMDGFDPNAGIIVIAATNRPDILDPALLRPGRFDRRVVVDNPDSKGRRAILEVHVRGKPLGDDVSLEVLAKHTPGFSGADLANLVNEAALLAARRNKKKITMAEMDEAIERVIAGPQRRSRILSPREREIAAYHEGGHALLGKLLPNADPPHKVTILPRGMALGYVISAPPEDKYTYTRGELLDRITAALGGRVAEELVFGEVTTGAQNDFEQATDLARRMVTEFGMSEKLGPLSLGKRHGPVFLGRDLVETRNYSEEIAYEIDKEVRRIIDECYDRARTLITEHRDRLERVARALLERESLEGEELERVLAGEALEAPAVAVQPQPAPGQPALKAEKPVEKPLPTLKPKPEAS
ncbi:MAG: ATP-dependent zinc metalloprotease FtsH [Armatimonadota bacterium]|nr:ATP-dependent zinc metalloprotease FtsH [Armatimonadota bacterium]MDR7451600.1 ATP-dependent zinc metalloprotease FtsH [Armatimonadota bacterium]MDR7467680.1 ATP-dependent zinc metalloprotease FtsH [Armatimonadota bacterium]MDR7492569.1 ATP-dependent zinc metalloprotease FtsH [Armatimonadota bacterium]MDR7499963.1 ATP-dependent zinc metalloprotease FtsH [Armatimonadota bacterium]